MWQIVYRVLDQTDRMRRVAQGTVGMPTLEQALLRLTKRIREGIGSGIDLAEEEIREEYLLEADLRWVHSPSSSSSEESRMPSRHPPMT